MKRIFSIIALLVIVAFLAGCGETVHGAIKDTRRVGTGVRKIFVRD